MVMKTDYEKKLLDASKTFDSAISKKDVSPLSSLLAKDAILHHDGITRGDDITGSDNILKWLQSYPDQYEYKSHEVIAGAVDEQNKSAFSFFLDQGVKPSGSDTPSTDTASGTTCSTAAIRSRRSGSCVSCLTMSWSRR
jgi:hypothetical protein